MKVTFKKLDIDPVVFFHGSDEEISLAIKKEDKRAKEIENIIFSDGFNAMEYTTDYEQKRILHRNTRPGALFQVSYIDSDGIPSMHENYIRTKEMQLFDEAVHTKEELLKLYVNASNEHDLTLHIL